MLNVTKADEGKYTCLVENAVGRTARFAYLTVTDGKLNFSYVSLSLCMVSFEYYYYMNGFKTAVNF